MIQLLLDFQDTLKVLLGALVGILGGLLPWHLQEKIQKKRHREQLLLNAIQLATRSLTYTRCVFYAKFGDLKTLIDLPENPLDELLAIVLVHFPTAFAATQQLHHLQQDIYEFDIKAPSAVDKMKEITEEMALVVTKIVKELNRIGAVENMGLSSKPDRKKLKQIPPMSHY